MNKFSPHTLTLQRALHRADQAFHGINSNLDMKQFALAAKEFGRLQEIAEGITELCKSMDELLHQASQEIEGLRP